MGGPSQHCQAATQADSQDLTTPPAEAPKNRRADRASHRAALGTKRRPCNRLYDDNTGSICPAPIMTVARHQLCKPTITIVTRFNEQSDTREQLLRTFTEKPRATGIMTTSTEYLPPHTQQAAC
ncbi:hypothetical protein NDU88_001669 [Pleurodeles waltl]|uniref:Uncharacterized protein n=1 Tax=Pleurodeles waltl TaxID=8319 RepID=A0AAV7U7I3_PLEWA|nr:hypothetical protein NDU88_001669 [Pleurodeles waltl]